MINIKKGKTKMKKNRIFILGIVTMFVAILSLTLVSGTLARYTSSGKGSDSVQVAKWDVRIDTESLTSVTPSSHTFELFKVGANYDEDYNDVAAERIAPGFPAGLHRMFRYLQYFRHTCRGFHGPFYRRETGSWQLPPVPDPDRGRPQRFRHDERSRGTPFPSCHCG